MSRIKDFLDIEKREKNVETSESSLKERWKKLNDKEAELKEKESELIAKEKDIKKRLLALRTYNRLLTDLNKKLRDQERDFLESKQAMIEELAKEHNEIKKRIAKETERLKRYEDSLSIVEHNALINIRRLDAKEIDYLSALTENFNKIEANPSIVRKKNGYAFEHHIKSVLIANSYENVEVTNKSGDYGADVIAEKDGLRFVFQCKFYSKPVGVKAVQEAFSAIKVYNADKAVVVTNNVFTLSARELAEKNDVDLWDCSTLAELNVNGEFF